MPGIVEQLERPRDAAAARPRERVAGEIEETRAVDREDEQDAVGGEQAARGGQHGVRIVHVLEEVPHGDGLERCRLERRSHEVAFPHREAARARLRDVALRKLHALGLPPGVARQPQEGATGAPEVEQAARTDHRRQIGEPAAIDPSLGRACIGLIEVGALVVARILVHGAQLVDRRQRMPKAQRTGVAREDVETAQSMSASDARALAARTAARSVHLGLTRHFLPRPVGLGARTAARARSDRSRAASCRDSRARAGPNASTRARSGSGPCAPTPRPA